jgi:hypothetical protein
MTKHTVLISKVPFKHIFQLSLQKHSALAILHVRVNDEEDIPFTFTKYYTTSDKNIRHPGSLYHKI